MHSVSGSSQGSLRHPSFLHSHVLLRLLMPKKISSRLRLRDEADGTVLFHSCASTGAKSTRAMRLGCSYDHVLSARQCFEPSARGSGKSFCVAVGKTGRRVDRAYLRPFKVDHDIRGYEFTDLVFVSESRKCSIDGRRVIVLFSSEATTENCRKVLNTPNTIFVSP
jgi:hypothetical protein